MSIYTRDQHLGDADTIIGEYSYGGLMVSRSYPGSKLNVGKFCSFGQGIQVVFWGKHQMGDITTYPFCNLHGLGWPPVSCSEVKGEDVRIGSDVWIANNALIMQGADIGDGSVIGAHSIVGGKVEPYSLVVGNPARLVRKRFSEDKIAMLLEMKWWDWPIEKVKEHLQAISSPDVDYLYEIWKREIR